MKHLLLTSFLLLALVSVKAQSTPPSADEIMEDARKQADKEHKNVFVMFHASWCGWCHRMDNSMNDETCKKLFTDKYVIRHLVVDESADKLNLENPGAKELRTKYYGDGQGIPYWLIFDKDGKLLSDCKIRETGMAPESGNNIGCPSSEKEVAYFLDILKKTSGLNSAQLEIIRKRFRENDK